MQNLKVTIIQSDLKWEDKLYNLEQFATKIGSIKEDTDIIVLPEMFTTGFTMKAKEFAEPLNSNTLAWMQTQAKLKNTAITGSFICEENNKYYNRLLWVNANGDYFFYDKRHLFRMANEDETYSNSSKKLIVNCKGWNIALQVCYDLRFPVWSRRTKEYNYDALIYVANWPERRALPWKVLLQARAIENQSYVIGVNRIGNDGNDVYHSGDSCVFDFKGEKISQTSSSVSAIETLELNKANLDDFRNNFPAHLDADDFVIKLD